MTTIKEWTKEKLKGTVVVSFMGRKLSAYEKGKANARYLAEEYQYESSEWSLSWREFCEWTDYFYRLGKRYGLLEEFKENAII
jgi:hypothetical protein